MKSVYIALGVFAVIIAVSVSGYCLATGFAQTMLDDLKDIKQAVAHEDFGAAGEKTSECIKRLDGSNIWLAALANHEELNSMKTGLMRLEQYISYSDTAEAMAQNGELIGLLEHFYKSELVTVENVL